MTRRMNLEGNVYGELTVISFSHTTESNRMSNYLCRCSCGVERVVSHGNLRSGHTTSCGCKRPRGEDSARFVHGFPKTHKTYKSWCKIKERCYNKNCKDYATYGAKGVSLQDEFREDFLAFYAELGEAPNDGQRWSVDRIDHTKNYEKGNMKWSTDYQQARNKGKSKSNTSGVTGVSWDSKGDLLYSAVGWRQLDDNGEMVSKKKVFSVKKLGLLPAFAGAVKFRKVVIQHLRDQGYEYAENHGE